MEVEKAIAAITEVGIAQLFNACVAFETMKFNNLSISFLF